MSEKELPTSSDESDEDFVPESEPSSDDSLSDHSEDISDEDKGRKSRKRKRVTKKKKPTTKARAKKAKVEEVKKVDKKIDIDTLWADFKEDVSKIEKRILSHQPYSDPKPKQETSSEEPKPETSSGKRDESKDEPTDEASGTKKRNLPTGMKKGKLGLNKILDHLSKKDKMSTLAKSKLDWFNFKKSEGIDEEIKTHNKGKGGYLEKQEFLQRTDLRQFEIEKQMRASKRKNQ